MLFVGKDEWICGGFFCSAQPLPACWLTDAACPSRGRKKCLNTPTVPIFLVFSYIYRKIPDQSDPEYADCFSSVAYPFSYPVLSISLQINQQNQIVELEKFSPKIFLIFLEKIFFSFLFSLFFTQKNLPHPLWQVVIYHLLSCPNSKLESHKIPNRSPPRIG